MGDPIVPIPVKYNPEWYAQVLHEWLILSRAVVRYGGWEDSSRGKGSHTMFLRRVDGGVFSYPLLADITMFVISCDAVFGS
ncbi:MAG: hypothetical protein JWP03_4393 [Phycisphaerales bacterium]|nr:hypothetical protein [Phycisphaerales bacterium]